MAKRRKKKKRFSLPDALLGAVDALCEGVARLCVGALRGLLRLLALLARGVWALLRLLVRALAAPFAWLARRISGRKRRAEQCLRLSGP